MSRKTLPILLVVSLFVLVLALPSSAAELTGKLTDKGWGKFKVKDESGVERLILESNKATSYEPNTWRPAEGDQISVAYEEVSKKGATNLVASKVTLVKAGPNTLELKSPVNVEIIEAGRSGVRAKVGGKEIKFWTGRGLKMSPAGWAPAAGEKATVTFRAETSGFNQKYVAEEITKQ